MPKVTPILTSGLFAARRRFPADAALVERLTRDSETFRELCDDLAACDAALGALASAEGKKAEIRRAECQEWIESLTKEIQEQLRIASPDDRADDGDKPQV